MFQAIQTSYLAPTNTLGARIRAKCAAGSIVVSWNHSLNAEDNHRSAANALRRKLGWTDYNFVSGELPSGGFAFVRIQ